MSQHPQNKMGTMPVGKLLISMSLPAMFSMLIQALYNVVDSIYVAQIGEDALTAVSLAFPVQNFLIAVSVGTCIGLNSLISRRLGERREHEASLAATHGVLIALVEWVGFLIFGLFFCRIFFQAFTDNPTVIQMGIDYTSIVTIFSFGCFVEITLEKTLQATGNMIYPMLFQLTGAITNIILDPIFIFGFGMGVKGAALATIISQCVSSILCIAYISSDKSILRLKITRLKIVPSLLFSCLALGISTFIMQSTESIISVCFNSSLLKYGGDIAVGAMTISASVMQMGMLPLQGISQGAQPISSYSYGKGDKERVKKCFKYLLLSSFAFSFVLWVLIELFPSVFASIFSPDPLLVEYASKALRVYMGATLVFGIQISCQMTFIAVGNAVSSIIVAVLRKFVLLIPMIYIIPHFFQNKTMGVFAAEPIADFMAVTCTAIIFYFQFRASLRKIDEREKTDIVENRE